MIVTTEAIVLSAMNFRDTSKIVRMYTREFGKVSVVAKGARDTKSKFRSSLEPMRHVTAVIYKNDNRELQLLSQCDSISSFLHLMDEMEKMYVAMSAIELVDVITHDEERNEDLFTLLLNHLQSVNAATKNVRVALYYFETRLSALLGFKPELLLCSYCGKRTEDDLAATTKFSLTDDGVLCRDCSESSGVNKVSSAALKVLQRLQEVGTVESAMTLIIAPTVMTEVARSLRQHFARHIEGFRGLRSEEVFAEIL